MIIKKNFSKFQDKLHFFRIPGVFQNNGQFPGLFKVCTSNAKPIGPVVSDEMFENIDGWTTDALLYYKLIYEPKGPSELDLKTLTFCKCQH